MSVCNIFKPTEGPVFYTFSEYNNDLINNINNNSDVSATPSSFICLNITDTSNLVEKIQNYENAAVTLRDENITGKTGDNYKKYLLGGLLNAIGYTDEPIAKGDIDVFGDDTIDGMKYNEILCYLGPDADATSVATRGSEMLSIDVDGTFKGYEGKELPEGCTSVVSGTYEFPDVEINESSDATSNPEFTFNSVIVMYEISGVEVPMGIYISPTPIQKIVSSTDIYSQGASYVLRIGMRFASTFDGSIYVKDTDITDSTRDVTTLISLLDKMNKTISEFQNMAKKYQEYSRFMNDRITALINSYINRGEWWQYNQ